MATTYKFSMTRSGTKDREFPDQKVEITLTRADELTLNSLLEYISEFITASGYLVKGPLQFIEMEKERTLQRLSEPKKKAL